MRAAALLLSAVLFAGCFGAKGPQPHYYDDPFGGKGAPASAVDAVNATRLVAASEHPGAHLAYVTTLELGNVTGIAAPWDVFYVDEARTEDYWYVGVNGSAKPGGMPAQKLPAGFPAAPVGPGWTMDSPAAVAKAMQDPEFARVAAGQHTKLRMQLFGGDGAPQWSFELESDAGKKQIGFPAS